MSSSGSGTEERICELYQNVEDWMEDTRCSIIGANVGSGRVYEENEVAAYALLYIPSAPLDESGAGGKPSNGGSSRRRKVKQVKFPASNTPPVGTTWARARTDLRTPDALYDGYYVPYFGDSDDKFKASQKMALDLVTVSREIHDNQGSDEDGPVVTDLSDVENLHPYDESAPGKRVAKLAWERAAKRITIREVVESGEYGDSLQSLVLPLSRALEINAEHITTYFASLKHRERMWAKFEDEVTMKKGLTCQFHAAIQGDCVDSAKAQLSSDSLNMLLCRQCYLFDCMTHGLDSHRVGQDLPDSTRTDSMPSAHVQFVKGRCQSVNPGSCWLACREAGSEVPPVALSCTAMELATVLRKNMGDDPCRICEMIRVVDTVGSADTACADVGHFLSSLSAPLQPKQVRNVKRGRTVVPTNEAKAMFAGKRLDFTPCNHEGPCTSKNCDCVRTGVNCEKTCGCNLVRVSGDRIHPFSVCKRAHGGCACKSASACRTSSCACFSARRECDPDLCRSCGAGNAPGEDRACCNSGLRLHSRYRTAAGRSSVHGWGVYAREPIPKGELVGEYVGELITQDEAERRGRVYDEVNTSFLFTTTTTLAVDSTRLGSKLKYCNHSETANCEPRVMRVGSDVRVGIYARNDIPVMQELFFDYGYGKTGPAWSVAAAKKAASAQGKDRAGSGRGRSGKSRAAVSDSDDDGGGSHDVGSRDSFDESSEESELRARARMRKSKRRRKRGERSEHARDVVVTVDGD